MPKKQITKRAPNQHAIRTGILIKQIRAVNPNIKQQEAMAMASKQAAQHKGKGMYLSPYPK